MLSLRALRARLSATPRPSRPPARAARRICRTSPSSRLRAITREDHRATLMTRRTNRNQSGSDHPRMSEGKPPSPIGQVAPYWVLLPPPSLRSSTNRKTEMKLPSEQDETGTSSALLQAGWARRLEGTGFVRCLVRSLELSSPLPSRLASGGPRRRRVPRSSVVRLSRADSSHTSASLVFRRRPRSRGRCRYVLGKKDTQKARQLSGLGSFYVLWCRVPLRYQHSQQPAIAPGGVAAPGPDPAPTLVSDGKERSTTASRDVPPTSTPPAPASSSRPRKFTTLQERGLGATGCLCPLPLPARDTEHRNSNRPAAACELPNNPVGRSGLAAPQWAAGA